ncbi:MAG: PAS domain-containing protein [Desulfurella sp.]|uniref:PAS domain S-box-containing protein n=2 Tax=Desulfurella multipotens TaxID=79269 RepID=A0A1G6R8C3_9BACT|nr:PAS domain-containing protein [Desulfurella multipotens]SDD00345.1 hypothetical protein SAMN05660835_01738 [Desulfurella multipotens]
MNESTLELFEDLDIKVLLRVLDNLPCDVSFVDKDDNVVYFNLPREGRTFARTKLDIGRKVQKCHPPKSLHLVQKILDDFRAKKRKSADFWINFEGRFLYIRYFPVYDENGDYYGTLEVMQDVKEIQKLQGEKRLLDDENSAE